MTVFSGLFDDTVALLRKEYAAELRHTTVVNLSAPGAVGQIRRWAGSIHPKFRRFLSPGKKDPEWAEAVASEYHDGLAMLDPLSGKAIIATSTLYDRHEFHKDPAKELVLSLLHEAGHLIVKGGISAYIQRMDRKTTKAQKLADHYTAETSADTFMTASGLRLGVIDRQEAADISFNRTMNVWQRSGIQYGTALSIDRMLSDEANTRFQVLTPPEIRQMAEYYADTAGVGPENLVYSKSLLLKMRSGGRMPKQSQHHRMEEWLENVASVSQKAHGASLASYLSTKILSTVLETGKISYPAKRSFNVSASRWVEARETLKARAAQPGGVHQVLKAG